MSSAVSSPGPSSAAAVVVRGSVVNMVAMVAGAAMSFGLVVLVSRWLQPRGAGAFFELIALFTILSNTFELGADTGLTRWISRARAIGGLSDVRRIVLIAMLPVAVAGTAAAAALWLYAPQIAHLFLRGITPAAGVGDIRMIAPLIPLGALSSCIVDGARGFGRMWPYLVIEGLGKPAVRILLVIAVLMAGLGLHAAIIAWGLPVLAGLVLGCLIFTGILRKEVPAASPGTRRRDETPGRSGRVDHSLTAPASADAPLAPPEAPADVSTDEASGSRRRDRAKYPAFPALDATVEMPVVFDPVAPVATFDSTAGSDRGRHRGGRWRALDERTRDLAAEFWGFTGPRAFQATFQVVILWLDILIVGALTDSYHAGVYSAVSKLALVGSFALEGNRLAIAPQLSQMLARREHDRAAQLYQSTTRWLILASWPLYLVFAVFPAVVLGIFGPRYAIGGTALTVLSLAMLVNLGTGNNTVVLLMGGKSTWSMVNAGAALAANIGLNLVLVPRLGITGAAIAWAASIVIDNGTAMVEIRLVMGMAPFGRGYFAAAGITVFCFGAIGLAARLMFGQTPPALGVALSAGLPAFILALYFARNRLELTGMATMLRPPGRSAALPAGSAARPVLPGALPTTGRANRYDGRAAARPRQNAT